MKFVILVLNYFIKRVKYYLNRIELYAQIVNLGKFTSGDISNNVIFKIPSNVYLGDNVIIGPNCILGSLGKITLGNNTRLSEGVVIETAFLKLNELNYGKHNFKDVVIGNNVWVAMHSIVLPGVSIGDNSFIAAGSIVDRDVPANSIFKRGEIQNRNINQF